MTDLKEKEREAWVHYGRPARWPSTLSARYSL